MVTDMSPPARARLAPLLGLALAGLAAAALVAAPPAGSASKKLPRKFESPNAAGVARTVSSAGRVELDHPFFRSLGTNGRSCATCHVPEEAFTLTPAGARRRFDASAGQDPLFTSTDGAVSPLADLATPEARRAAFAPLLERGLLRVGLPIPDGAEFVLEAVDDPHGHASASDLSLFRRVLPATNLRFLTAIMWDGRENRVDQGLVDNLARQADTATRVHAEATGPLDPADAAAIVSFTLSLHTVQWRDLDAGRLPRAARRLDRQEFYPGINSAGFDPDVFTVFEAWARANRRPARAAAARGAAVFNRRLLDQTGLTCSTCHNAPNVGVQSRGGFFDLGLSDEDMRGPGLPLYTLRCLATGEQVRTTDPGRALVTGRCGDINAFKVPALRGLAGRAPYFHNGAAATLADVVAHYERRFGFELSDAERADLLAFLRTL